MAILTRELDTSSATYRVDQIKPDVRCDFPANTTGVHIRVFGAFTWFVCFLS